MGKRATGASAQLAPEDEHQDFFEGYRDGRNPDCPEPSENRSERYKHSFRVGRDELTGTVKRASMLRVMAELAAKNDDDRWDNRMDDV